MITRSASICGGHCILAVKFRITISLSFIHLLQIHVQNGSIMTLVLPLFVGRLKKDEEILDLSRMMNRAVDGYMENVRS